MVRQICSIKFTNKPFVLGRKNWLFAGSEDGARSSCLLFSLIECAKIHNIFHKESGFRPKGSKSDGHMIITKMYQIIMMFLLTCKRMSGTISHQPSAISHQVIFTVIILYFVIYILCIRAVSDFFRLLFFLCLFGQAITGL